MAWSLTGFVAREEPQSHCSCRGVGVMAPLKEWKVALSMAVVCTPQASSAPQPAPPTGLLFLLLSPHRLRAWWSALLAFLRHPSPLLPRLPVDLTVFRLRGLCPACYSRLVMSLPCSGASVAPKGPSPLEPLRAGEGARTPPQTWSHSLLRFRQRDAGPL